MNQKQALLNYLKNKPKGITQWSAANDLGILRLSQRIRELEDDGVKIIRVREKAIGRYGHTVMPMRYRIANGI